jgi:uncharacterized protein
MRLRPALQLLVFSLALVAPIVDAAGEPSYPAPPPPGRFIADTAGLVGADDGASIDGIAAALLAERKYPIAVVTIRSLAAHGAAGHTIEQYAAELLRSWPADRHLPSHGMLLLVAADDRLARIQLGSAWGAAHDDRARKVMDRLILPAFRKGAFSTGILGGVRGFDAMGRQHPLPTVGQPSWVPSALVVDGLDQPWWTVPAIIAGAIVLVLLVVSLVRTGRRGWAWAAVALVFGIVLSRLLGGRAEASGAGGGASGEW